jgi:hypothetical protein
MKMHGELYQKYEKICAYLFMIVMAVSLGVVMYLGRYNHPTGDDYYYGVETGKVWAETGNIALTFKEAAKGVAYEYVNWQGTYSAMFLMYLPPNIFGEGAYKLVTCVILLLYMAGVFYLMKPVICTVLKGSGYMWCAVAAAFVILTIQTVPFKGESMYWYNGAMYYTGYFAMTLVFFGMMIRYLLSGKKRYVVLMALEAVFLAGGNYVSLLPALLISCLVTALLIGKHSKKSIPVAVITFLMLAGLFVSAAAPGNQMRESGLWEMSAGAAIMKALLQGISYMEAWIDRWWIMTAIILTPFFWHTYKNIRFEFKLPIVAAAFIYGIFCSMSCPTFYAMNSTGPARVLAIIYYGFMLFSLMAYYYILGYLYRYFEAVKLRAEVQNLAKAKRFVPHMLAATVFVYLAFMQIYSGAFRECTAVKAFQLLRNGEAAAYEQEYQERLKVLRDDTVQDVVFMPYENQPDMLFVGDFQGYTDNVNNQKVAEYFGKNSIMVQY